MKDVFTLRDEYIALCDLLKVCGVVPTGGSGKALVASGAVSVDGAVELRKTNKIRAGQVVTGEGFEIRVQAAPSRVS
jgi:ribosome-associated protein